MQKLQAHDSLKVRQIRELLEVFTSFECKNRYEIYTSRDELLYSSGEESLWYLRFFGGSYRPFTIHIQDKSGKEVIRLIRPFRFYFHEVQVYDAEGYFLGSVKREFSWLRRLYTVSDAQGLKLYQLLGPILKPWTFEIRQQGRTVGAIRKKWSGALKEVFTDADNFGIEFPKGIVVETKEILLGALFLIDYVHFETKAG